MAAVAAVPAATGAAAFIAIVAGNVGGGARLRRPWLPGIGILLVTGWLRMQGDLARLVWRAASRLDRRDAEREAALAETGDLSQRESFTHSLSHDLRAPLRTIAGFPEILSVKLGRVWAQSESGQDTTFRFTLGGDGHAA